MESVKHLLSFVTNSEANMLSVHLDSAGISFLIERLTILRELVDRVHLRFGWRFFMESTMPSENPFRAALAIVTERALVARFGQPYTDYMARTGRFIPRIAKK